MTQYFGVAHPSLPNYLAPGRTWKAYAEGLPSPGFLGGFSGRYAKKHDPFAYFTPIIDDPARRAQIVPLKELMPDAAAGELPDFAFVVPDLCNSMHDCPVRTSDLWLRRVVGPLLKVPRTAIFITFDEGRTSARGGGHVATFVVGTAVRRKSAFRAVTNQYGLLRTIEQAWALPLLGHSASAKPITGIWR